MMLEILRLGVEGIVLAVRFVFRVLYFAVIDAPWKLARLLFKFLEYLEDCKNGTP